MAIPWHTIDGSRRRAARVAMRLASWRWLVLHAGTYLLVNGFLVVVWLLSPDPATVERLPIKRLAGELVDRFGGWLVKSTGDGVLAIFDRPGRAIRCATALRDRLQRSGVEIRAGLHTGEVQFRGSDVGGIAIHIAARVMATAGAGEILVSRTVHDLVAGADGALDDRGVHTLRGMAGEWQLFAVRS